MNICIRLYGVFRSGRFKETRQSWPAGSKVAVIVEHLELPPQLLGIVLVNGRHADRDTVLEEGDTLSLLPVLDGG